VAPASIRPAGPKAADLECIAVAIDAEVAQSTRTTYASGWRGWETWCRSRVLVPLSAARHRALMEGFLRQRSRRAVLPVRHTRQVVVLVPRQIRMAGMTGDVPYYGGRFTPAQAYAAAHPPRPAAQTPTPPPAAQAPTRSGRDTLEALQHLLDTGVLTQAEFVELRARVEP
jgi:hypothetical protein